MTPAEAAALLGLPENATEAQIGEAYAAHIATVPESDIAAVDALSRARDALLAGARWQPPLSTGAREWSAPQPGFPPPPPAYPYPNSPTPTGVPGFGTDPQQQPYPYPGYPQPAAYPARPQPAAYPTRPRSPLSNGAIIGITLGGTAVLLVVLLIAVIALAGNTQRLANAAAQHGSASAPSSPPSGSDPSAADQSYVIDGVTIRPEQGWTFLLTSPRDCPAAEVIVGFADTVDGDSIDEHTDTVSLKAGVPYTYTVPDTASTHQYAGIDDLQCVPT